MQASTATVSHDNYGCGTQFSSRRRIRHGLMRARVATLERKETLRGLSVENNEHPDVKSIISSLENIRLLEASYQRDPEHPPLQQQQSTVADLVHSSGSRHAHATQLRRALRSSQAFAASDVSTLDSSSAGSPAVDESSIGASSAEALRTIMDLWHMLHEKQRTKWQQNGSGTRWWQDDPPRLLTATEERTLSTVVQQHRKLQQLYDEHPAAAAQLATPDTTADASWVKRRSQVPVSSTQPSSSSSSGQDKAKHGNIEWPPPLTAEDLAEVSSWSLAWRAMLPDLAQTAQQLLVSYNCKLVLHMRQFATSRDLPWEDLLQAGLEGLKVAAQRYNPDRKTRFSTMATLWILQAMNRTASNQSSGSRLPERYLKLWRHVLQKHGRQALLDIDKRSDVISEVSTDFAIKPATVLRILKSTSKWITAGSLEAPNYSGPNSSKGDDAVVPWSAMVTSEDLDDDEDADGDAAGAGLATEASYIAAAGQIPAWLQEHQHQQHIKTDDELQVQHWLSTLKPVERRVMMLLYSLPDGSTTTSRLSSSSSNGRSRGRYRVQRGGHNVDAKKVGHVALADVAEQMGYTPEGVRQIRMSAMSKLKAAAKSGTDTNLSSSLDALGKPKARPGIDTTVSRRAKVSSSSGTESANSSSSSRSYSKSFSSSDAADFAAVEADGVDISPSSRMGPSSSRGTDSKHSSSRAKRRRRSRSCSRAAGPKAVDKGGMDTMLSSRMGTSSSMPADNSNSTSSSSSRSSRSRDCSADAPAAAEGDKEGELQETVEHSVVTSTPLPTNVAAVIQGCSGRVQTNLRLTYYYYMQHKRIPASNVVVAELKLGQWCRHKRSQFSRGRASTNIVDAFRVIAPGWLPDSDQPLASRQVPWVSFRMYHAALVQYVQEFDALPNQCVKYQGLKLGKWVQSQQYRWALLSKRNRQALESVPSWEWLGRAAKRG